MTILKIALLLLLCLTLQQCNARVASFSKSIYHPDKEIIFDGRTIRDPRLYYAACDTSQVDKKCKVIRNKEPYEQGTDECEVKLSATGDKGIVKRVRVLQFGKDRAILLWCEQTNSASILGLTSVKFSDCSTHEVTTPFDDNSVVDDYLLEVIDVATYENSYDVAFKYPKVCGDKYCRFSVDVERNETQGPVAWFSADRYGILDIRAIDIRSPDKGVVVSQLTSNEFFRVSLIKDDEYKVLRHYEDSGLIPPLSMESSFNNDLIGICVIINETLKCSQYNQTGMATFEFDRNYKNVALVAMYNLHQSVLILVNDRIENNRYWVLKLDSQGNVISTLDVEGIDCDQSLNLLMGIFYEKDGKYCFTTTCFENYVQSESKKDRGHLDKTTECFAIDDFLVAN